METDLDVCYSLLPRVSRTFALNIRILPGELRPAVTVAYLLFRFADTIEDVPGLTPAERTALFDTFLERLDGSAAAWPATQSDLLRSASANEGDLLRSGDALFRAFAKIPESSRAIISAHVSETAHGMDRISRERTTDGLLQLESWNELDEYCYYVAGTIGIMLTRLFAEHSRHIEADTVEHLTGLGTAFGRGLQLTNILKGIGVDRRDGRVYLPAEALRRHGTSPERILEPGSRAAVLAVVDEIVPHALEDLEEALRYTTLLPRREARLRLFCLWPLFAAVRTLGVVAQGRGIADEHTQPKISRQDLYREMMMSVAQVFSNERLRKRFARFRRDLFPSLPRGEILAG